MIRWQKPSEMSENASAGLENCFWEGARVRGLSLINAGGMDTAKSFGSNRFGYEVIDCMPHNLDIGELP